MKFNFNFPKIGRRSGPDISGPTSIPPQEDANKTTFHGGRTVGVRDRNTVNQPTNTRRSSLAPIRWIINFIQKIIGKSSPEQNNSPAPTARVTTSTDATGPNKSVLPGYAYAVVSGTTAAKNEFQTKVQGKDLDFQQAKEFFLSGDKGIRRATTSFRNMDGWLTPGLDNPDLDLPEAVKSQAQTLSKMGQQVANAGFNASIPADFTQYGDKGMHNPYYSTIEDGFTHLEPEIRAWAGKGVELASQLAQGWQRVYPPDGEPQPPFTQEELTTLQQQVDDFANMEARSAPDPDAIKRGPITGNETAI